MYHKINVPDCAHLLLRLTEIAGQAIAFGLTYDLSILDHYDWDGKEQKQLAKTLGDDFLAEHGGHRLLGAARDGFLKHFAEARLPEVGTWLWGKYAVVAARIVRLLVLPSEQKTDIFDAFKHDIDLDGILQRLEPKVFRFKALPERCNDAQAIIKDLLVSFYEDILVAKGVPADVLGEEEALDHQEILQSYRQMNLRLKVCPGCDGEPPLRVSARARPRPDEKPHHPLWLSANVDHFLPKSKYPCLAIHPLNLVPLCIVCNQDRKGENDPLDAVDVVDLDDIYHPYIRGAHDEVIVVVERDDTDGRPHLRFYPAVGVPHAAARLHSLEHVLGLEADWDGDLQDERLEIEVESALRNAIQDEREADERHLDVWLRDKIARISNNMTYDIGRKPRTVASRAYATWLATDAMAHQERVHLLNKALGIEPGSVNPVQRQVRPRPIY